LEHIQAIALALPRDPVKVGTSWNRLIEKSEPSGLNSSKKIVYTYRGPSAGPYRGSQIIDVKTALDFKADPKGLYRMDVRVKSQDGKGIIYFDNTAGHLLSMGFTQRYDQAVTMLGKESVYSREEHLKVSLRRDTQPRPRK
jgi:hypothetical protein